MNWIGSAPIEPKVSRKLIQSYNASLHTSHYVTHLDVRQTVKIEGAAG
jgi:hypothetical protein